MSFGYRHLKCFLVVARTQSVTRAAEELNVSQPAMTQTIRNLEEIVGTPLFDRTTKGVSLTSAGHDFSPVATRLIAEIDYAIGDLRGYAEIRRGRVSVSGVPSVACGLLPRMVKKLLVIHPNLKVVIFDGLSGNIEEMILRGQVDFGLTSPVGSQSELTAESVARERLDLICARDHPLASSSVVTWEQICEHRFIGLSRQSSTRMIVDRAFASIGRVIDTSYDVEHISTAAGIVAEGLGVTIIPRSTRVLIARSDLVFRPIEEPIATRNVCLIRRADRSLSPAAEVLWDLIRCDRGLWREHGLEFLEE